MFEYIDEERMRNDIEMIMRFPPFKASLFHKVEELKGKDENGAGKIREFRELESLVDPVPAEKETGKKKTKNVSLKQQINFEIEKIKRRWTVHPDIPQEIVNHIISHDDLEPGVIKMEKFGLHGQMIDLSFEMKSPSLYIGSIIEKCSEKNTKKSTKPAKSTGSKKDKLKTVIAYMVDNEIFSEWVINEFFGKWKNAIDNGFCFTSEINERSYY
jgi:hypothetical protein